MTKIAVILILVGLTTMTSAYRMNGQVFDQKVQNNHEEQDERAQRLEQLQGIIFSIICTLHVYIAIYHTVQ